MRECVAMGRSGGEPNNRAGLLPPRLLGTGLEIFTSSDSSHYYPFGCQLRIDVEFSFCSLLHLQFEIADD